MGTKYTTTAVVGYNSTPPADDGTASDANKIKWSTIKTKLPDPLNTAIAAIDTKLVDYVNVGPVAKTTTYTTVAGDHNKTLECSGTFTVSLMDASSAGAGYTVEINNQGTGTITVGRATAGDTINTVAGNVTLAAKVSMTFRVIAAATGYAIITIGRNDFGTAALVNTGTSGGTVPLLNAANTFSAAQTVGSNTSAAALNVNGPAGALRPLLFQTAGSARFYIYANPSAESGANAGTDIVFSARADDGTAIVWQGVLTRSTGVLAISTGTLNAVNLQRNGSNVLAQSDIFVSADQTITGAGSLTLAHGLGAAPRLVLIAMVCQTAEIGYSIGDVVQTGAYGMPATFTDATNIGVRFYNGSQSIPHKTTGVSTYITFTSWKMRFLAIK
jgi:hypothetical protein